MRQDRAELVVAEPEQEVVLADLGARLGGEQAQDEIAELAAEAVVDGVEAVVDALGEGAAVHQAGELVFQRLAPRHLHMPDPAPADEQGRAERCDRGGGNDGHDHGKLLRLKAPG